MRLNLIYGSSNASRATRAQNISKHREAPESVLGQADVSQRRTAHSLPDLRGTLKMALGRSLRSRVVLIRISVWAVRSVSQSEALRASLH